MIEYIKGDLLKSDCDFIIHGCNCFHTMGSGIAAQIKKKYPEAYESDLKTPYGDVNKLGTYSFVETTRSVQTFDSGQNFPWDYTIYEITIVNAYTQFNFGGPPFYTGVEGRHADYTAINEVLDDIFNDFPNKVMGMPKIGCGLGGGDWNVVSEIIERLSNKYDKTIKVYEL